MKYLEDWLTERKVDEVECLVPDINGIPRGKILPASKFIKSSKGESLRLPSSNRGDYALEFNLPVGSNMGPWIIGMIVMAVGISFGANAGYAINPARDFGPRMFAWIAGWGKVAFPGDYAFISNYFWVPIVGPLVGAGLASWFYDATVRDILMARKGPEPGVMAEGETVQDVRPPAPDAP